MDLLSILCVVFALSVVIYYEKRITKSKPDILPIMKQKEEPVKHFEGFRFKKIGEKCSVEVYPVSDEGNYIWKKTIYFTGKITKVDFFCASSKREDIIRALEKKQMELVAQKEEDDKITKVFEKI